MNAFQARVFFLSIWFDSNCLVHWHTVETIEMRAVECITRQLYQDITNAENQIPKNDSDGRVIEILEDDIDAENQICLQMSQAKYREQQMESLLI